jgi:hypothetical protein
MNKFPVLKLVGVAELASSAIVRGNDQLNNMQEIDIAFVQIRKTNRQCWSLFD